MMKREGDEIKAFAKSMIEVRHVGIFLAIAKCCEHNNYAINQKIPRVRCRDLCVPFVCTYTDFFVCV